MKKCQEDKKCQMKRQKDKNCHKDGKTKNFQKERKIERTARSAEKLARKTEKNAEQPKNNAGMTKKIAGEEGPCTFYGCAD